MAVSRTDVISVPNGANSQLDWLDELSESHFEQKQVIYLSVDTDRKGRELCRELSRRLGVDRCRIVTYGEAYKDANELLVAEYPDALLKALEDAPIPAWKVRLRQKTYGSGCTNCLKRGILRAWNWEYRIWTKS